MRGQKGDMYLVSYFPCPESSLASMPFVARRPGNSGQRLEYQHGGVVTQTPAARFARQLVHHQRHLLLQGLLGLLGL